MIATLYEGPEAQAMCYTDLLGNEYDIDWR
jgi:hypothetical protein